MMLRSLILTIFLLSSPTFGLVESLFKLHTNCYTGCRNNYAAQLNYVDACKKGCDYKLHNENCASQCRSFSADEQLEASCVVGCSMMHSVRTDNLQDALFHERPRSIILIRLRQRPGGELSSFQNIFSKNPSDMFQDLIKQWKTDMTASISQLKDLDKSPELQNVLRIVQKIPTMDFSENLRLDSSNELSGDVFVHRQGLTQKLAGRVQHWTTNVRQQWNELVNKRPQMPIWILFTCFLALSAFFWYMIVSLCSHPPSHRNLSIRAQELVLDNSFEKEKMQPFDHQADSIPIKVKLVHI